MDKLFINKKKSLKILTYKGDWMLALLKKNIIYSLVLVIILLLSSLSYYIYAHPEDDFLQFVSLSEEIYPEDYTFILKHSSFYKSYENQGDFEQIGNLLMDELQMPHGESLIELNHLVYTSFENKNGTNFAVKLTGMNNDKSTYLTITLDSNHQSLDSLSKTKTKIEATLEKLNINVNWNSMIQGIYTKSEEVDFLKLWEQLNKQLQLNEIETYTGQRTISNSYYSPNLNSKILSGSNPMNIQVALHQNSLNDEWQLTIGSPIITMEY
ncbi:YwmB family TATA-box binding protein [Chengkuizengella sp. SCS-71B]|uniref:YwmB family TATA-box binding protein n=1 Tax=Chengkuizengella sp. SCS-71B TaxID=3115290 RepID=UPI0032C2425C